MAYKTTTNWLYSDLWCSLFIACFGSKIGLFSTDNANKSEITDSRKRL